MEIGNEHLLAVKGFRRGVIQDKAFDRLDKAGLSKEQSAVVDKAISAANDCGATYGAIAYRLGLQDGIRLASEIKEFE